MVGVTPSRRVLLAGLTGLLTSALPGRASASTNAYYQGPVSDHFDGTRFFNPHSPAEDRSMANFLR